MCYVFYLKRHKQRRGAIEGRCSSEINQIHYIYWVGDGEYKKNVSVLASRQSVWLE